MNVALLVARLLLAGIFGVAGIAKLFDRKGSREALGSFGVPAALAGPFAILLPLAELGVAVSLLPVASAWYAAAGALGLLALFIAGIAFNLAKGRKPKCRCFGQLHSKPVGWTTVVRNFGLAAIAAFIVVRGRSGAGVSIGNWVRSLTPAERVETWVGATLFALLGLAGLVLVQIIQQQGRMLRRLDLIEAQFAGGRPSSGQTAGLAVGDPAPAFTLPNLDGKTVSLDDLRAGNLPVVLLFWDPDCGPCDALMPDIGRWQRDYAHALTLVAVSRGSAEANRAKIDKHKIVNVLIQQENEVDDLYHATGTPMAVLVRPDGTIGSPVVGGSDKILSLIGGLAGELGASPLLTVPATDNGHAVSTLVN